MRTHKDHYINGQWVPATGSSLLPVTNPATDEIIAEVGAGSADDVDRAVAAARAAFDSWAATPVSERARYLGAIAQGLTERADELAEVISSEMGSPLSFARAAQVPLPINSFAQSATIVTEFEFEQSYRGSTIVREPYGVIGAITPWNYPLHQIALKAAYGMAAGNTVVVKPSENTPLNAIILAEIVEAAGLPAGVFNVVFGTGPEVGEAIASHPDVDLVSFTGSTRAGRRVSELASGTVKRVSLELGGKSPNILLDDADLNAAVPAAVQAAMINSGQTCSALTRLLVPRAKLAEVEGIAKAVTESITVGDPTDETTVLGPLSSRTQQERVLGYIRKGIDEGARVVTGGQTEPAEGGGAYVSPTVFSDVTPEMTIHREEIFGPVLAIEPYDTEEEAVAIANDTIYGLAGGVWSGSTERAQQVARKIRAGQIAVNDAGMNLDAPFGGYKQSGIGREAGQFGLEEFLEVKSIQG
ncbi:aldehyde dehydrogenase family protein [Gordonia sp. Z-3]|jgi:betaine-aldehyde dehydrogenase|uniref:Aldehyde dehydrogenase family protein n=1 Tax=Gordonia aquimaris TaxID=2984863 RepID=A0A9X3D790_9ACTN|nr:MULTISPECIES: aldehyde dehydrogenase family protein [Gordonia]MAU81964.1 aldehyde dehydrogenase family protein [Gordonia sp. (in: high G+C Gram-positive bacteria)]MCX2966440.1 aldehyde dehydrogenase family protein [Gordonia aquimaris]MED5801770.1 aldehyde dehydrogenase family protein [Gordonia sp. Z-3]